MRSNGQASKSGTVLRNLYSTINPTNPTIAIVLKRFMGGIGYKPGEGTRSCLAVSTHTA
jgi:hypothetical protein